MPVQQGYLPSDEEQRAMIGRTPAQTVRSTPPPQAGTGGPQRSISQAGGAQQAPGGTSPVISPTAAGATTSQSSFTQALNQQLLNTVFGQGQIQAGGGRATEALGGASPFQQELYTKLRQQFQPGFAPKFQQVQQPYDTGVMKGTTSTPGSAEFIGEQNVRLESQYANRSPQDLANWEQELQKMYDIFGVGGAKQVASKQNLFYEDVYTPADYAETGGAGKFEFNEEYLDQINQQMGTNYTQADIEGMEGRAGELRYLLEGPQKPGFSTKYGLPIVLAAMTAAGGGALSAGAAGGIGEAGSVLSSLQTPLKVASTATDVMRLIKGGGGGQPTGGGARPQAANDAGEAPDVGAAVEEFMRNYQEAQAPQEPAAPQEDDFLTGLEQQLKDLLAQYSQPTEVTQPVGTLEDIIPKEEIPTEPVKLGTLPTRFKEFAGLTPLQQRTGIASEALYGGGIGEKEENYFLDMLQNYLLEQGDANIDDILKPVETQFLSMLGLSGQTGQDILRAIARRRRTI